MNPPNSNPNSPPFFRRSKENEVYSSFLSKEVAIVVPLFQIIRLLMTTSALEYTLCLFFEANGVQLDHTKKELIGFDLGVAAGNLDVNDMLNWLTEHGKKKIFFVSVLRYKFARKLKEQSRRDSLAVFVFDTYAAYNNSYGVLNVQMIFQKSYTQNIQICTT